MELYYEKSDFPGSVRSVWLIHSRRRIERNVRLEDKIFAKRKRRTMDVFKMTFLCSVFLIQWTYLISVIVSSPVVRPRQAEQHNGTLSVKCKRTHTVTTGEVPFTIARQYRISPEKLQFLNPSMDVHDLESKQRLCVAANKYPETAPGAVLGREDLIPISIYRSVDWLIDWSIGFRLIHWLIARLVDWLIDSFHVAYFLRLYSRCSASECHW